MDADTHEVICAYLSLNDVTDAKAFPGLIRQNNRKVKVTSADGTYPAAKPSGLMGGVVGGQKTGGRQAEAYREQYLLEMEYGL